VPGALDVRRRCEGIAAIAETAAAHRTPEDINDGLQTAPPSRLRKAFAAYEKTLHGPLAIAAIGVDRVRAACPHFARWLDTLESIATAP
jgi:hypothetical protein